MIANIKTIWPMAFESERIWLAPCETDGEAVFPVAFGFFLAVWAENL